MKLIDKIIFKSSLEGYAQAIQHLEELKKEITDGMKNMSDIMLFDSIITPLIDQLKTVHANNQDKCENEKCLTSKN